MDNINLNVKFYDLIIDFGIVLPLIIGICFSAYLKEPKCARMILAFLKAIFYGALSVLLFLIAPTGEFLSLHPTYLTLGQIMGACLGLLECSSNIFDFIELWYRDKKKDSPIYIKNFRL